MIKLIASDVDGTLVEDGKININPQFFETIKKLKEKGILFAAASGRQCPSIKNTFKPIVDEIFIIAENGGYISCREHDIYEKTMDQHITDALIDELCQIPDSEFMVCTKERAYVNTKDEMFIDMLVNGYKYELANVDDLKAVENIIKISFYNKNDVWEAGKDTWHRWENRVKAALAGNGWMDFMDKDVNKGQALAYMQKELMITPEETMVFGDQINDIEMLKQAVHSYAVENACPEAKEAASAICGKNTEDGVLNIIKTLL